jgi:galactose mutarotase-like enzyme
MTFRATTHEGLESVEIEDAERGDSAVLAPERGGLLTRLHLGGAPVLYLDEETLRDRSKNVRGGIPVLFPQPGKLAGGAYRRAGGSGKLAQHGFARNLPWEVVKTSADGAASATLRFVSNDTTRAEFPWDFALEYTYALRAGALRIELVIRNTGREPMPFGAGFHPYFAVPEAEKRGAKIETRATRAFDNVTKKTGALPASGIDLTAHEVDLHLEDHGARPIALAWSGGRVGLRGSAEFGRWVVWTLAGKDFVCVEPWTCPGDALNTGEGLIELAPGEARTLWVEIGRT